MSEEIKRPMTPGEAEAAYLTIRQRNLLTDAGLDFSDLQYVSKWDILRLRNMGRHSIEILTRALAACGLTWGRYRLDEFKEKRDQIVAGEAITRRLMAQAQEPDACIDWDAFRREAAMDAMSGMMANADYWQHVWSHNRVNGRCDYPSEIAHFAIACADELIKQLKEESK